MTKRENLKKLTFPFILLVALIIGSLIYPHSNKLTVQTIYSAPMNGTKAFGLWDTTGAGFSESNMVSSEVADFGSTLSFKHDTDHFLQLALKPTDINEVCGIACINISINDNDILSIPANEIEQYFQPSSAVGSFDEASGAYFFAPLEGDSILLMNKETYQNITHNAFHSSNINSQLTRIGTSILIVLILSLLILKWDKLAMWIDGLFEDKSDIFTPIAAILFIIATLAVCVIAFKSELGLHPDEYDVVECLKYGMKHFFPPDIRDAEVAGTFSGYGYTKLENSTYYFFLAGKIALIAKTLFSSINWFRVPNVLLFIGMGIIFMKNVKRKNWLILALGTSIQAWYIFSYTTADALDFFWSFLVLLQLADDDSWLNSILSQICEKKHFSKSIITRSLILGILFGMVFLGKQNYWIVLLLAFVVLLSKLLGAEKEDRKQYFKIYGLILAMFAMTVLTRYAFDFAHYGTQGSQIKASLDAQYADYDKNPTTAPVDLCPTYRMKDHGYSINDLFVETPKWFKYSFQSFCGLLADQETSLVYYGLMGFLYLSIIILLGADYLTSENKQKKTEFIVGAFLLVLNVIISVLNSYISDSQAQGRYLLPMVFILGYLGAKAPSIWDKRAFKYALMLINILCVWYFSSQAPSLLGINPWK